MKIKSYQTAFAKPNELVRIREITIPDDQAEGVLAARGVEALLGLAFYYGQNDAQPVAGCYSTSMGDVIELGESLYMVMAVGFRELPKGTLFEDLPRGERAMLAAFRGDR